MLVINANQNNELLFYFEQEYAYYLFVFSQNQGCREEKIVYSDESDCEDFQRFNVNVDLPSGVWDLAIYGQEDYSNLNPDFAEFIKEEKARITNNCDECADLLLATPNGVYIITPLNQYIEIPSNC